MSVVAISSQFVFRISEFVLHVQNKNFISQIDILDSFHFAYLPNFVLSLYANVFKEVMAQKRFKRVIGRGHVEDM